MEQYNITTDTADSKTTASEKVIELLLIALFAFMPLAFGASRDWAREVVVLLSAFISIIFLINYLYRRDFRITASAAYIPAAIFILIAAIQLVPLPAGLVNLISPNTAALKTELLSDIQEPERLSSMTLSFYPNATKYDLRILLAIAAVFFVVLNSFRNINQIKRILWAIALTGGFVAVIALGQELFGNGKIYWLVPVKKGISFSGPFANHSHYGQFMNLSIGAGLGLLMLKLKEDLEGNKLTAPIVFEYFSSSRARGFWLLVIIISLGAATVFMSLTRGGMIGMLVAAIFTTVIVAFRKSLKGHGWVMALTALAAFVCIVYTSFDAVYDRLATLRNLDQYDNRLQIIKDLTVCFKRFPILGTGMGTHRVVYPMYDSSTITAIATHAENEYAQVLEETGLSGLAMLIIFGAIVWTSYAKNIRSRNKSVSAITYGLGFGLIAILVHSASDFGQHLPANAFLSAIFCAIILSLANIEKRKKQGFGQESSSNRKFLKTTICCGALAIWVWALLGADNARIAEADWKEVQKIEQELVENDWQGTDEQYNKIILYASKAVEAERDNGIYQYWFNVYRWQQINQRIDWTWALVPEESIPAVTEIIEGLKKACTICPTYGPPYCVLGQLEMLKSDEPESIEKINRGFILAPCDPIACYVAGCADVEQGKIERSFEKLSKAVQLDGRYFRDVAEIYITRVERPDLALQLAGNYIGGLQYISSILEDTEEHKELSEQIRTKIITLLEEQCARSEASAYDFVTLANIYTEENKDNMKAIDCYQQALALDFGQVSWRLRLAELLAQTGYVNEAMQQARLCLKIRPQLKEAENLLGSLSVRKAALSETD